MPFNNTGTTNIDTYNDVGRDQHNIITVSDSIVHIHSPATARSSGTRRTILPFTLPSKQPYRELIDTVLEIQDAFEPIVRIMDTGPLNDLVAELSDVLTTTALAGHLMELMEEMAFKLVWHRRISDRVGRWNRTLKPVIEEVRRYREGLKFTMIGPIWRRVLWSVMWHLSPDVDIMVVGSRCHRELAVFKQPLLRLLATHRIYFDKILLFKYHHPHSRDLLNQIRTHLPLGPERPLGSLCTVTALEIYDLPPQTFPFDLFATHEDLHMILPGNGEFGWVDTSDQQIISPTKLASLRLRSSANLVLEPIHHIGPYICYSDEWKNVCPRCEQTVNAAPVWMECGCGLRFRNGIPDNAKLWRDYATTVEPSDKYVIVERLVLFQSQLSTIQEISCICCTATDFLLFLHHLADSGATPRSCEVKIQSWKRSALFPLILDNPNNLPILLPHLKSLHISLGSFDPPQTIFRDILNQFHMPQLTAFYYDHDLPVTTPPIMQQITQFILRHPTLEDVGIGKEGWTFSDVCQLILGLPHLKIVCLFAAMPAIEASDLELHSLIDLVEGMTQYGDHPLQEIRMFFESISGDTSSFPVRWMVNRTLHPVSTALWWRTDQRLKQFGSL